jgi:hypothetical protein
MRDLVVVFLHAIITICLLSVAEVSGPFGSSRHRAQALYAFELPTRPSPAKVSVAVFTMRQTKPGAKGPDAHMIHAVIDMKQRNPTWRCPRICRTDQSGLQHSYQ